MLSPGFRSAVIRYGHATVPLYSATTCTCRVCCSCMYVPFFPPSRCLPIILLFATPSLPPVSRKAVAGARCNPDPRDPPSPFFFSFSLAVPPLSGLGLRNWMLRSAHAKSWQETRRRMMAGNAGVVLGFAAVGAHAAFRTYSRSTLHKYVVCSMPVFKGEEGRNDASFRRPVVLEVFSTRRWYPYLCCTHSMCFLFCSSLPSPILP